MARNLIRNLQRKQARQAADEAAHRGGLRAREPGKVLEKGEEAVRGMKPIYAPKGKAKEYGDYAINIYTGCPHRCYYCFAPNADRL